MCESNFALEFLSTISVHERHWNVPLELVYNNFYGRDKDVTLGQNESRQSFTEPQ